MSLLRLKYVIPFSPWNKTTHLRLANKTLKGYSLYYFDLTNFYIYVSLELFQCSWNYMSATTYFTCAFCVFFLLPLLSDLVFLVLQNSESTGSVP